MASGEYRGCPPRVARGSAAHAAIASSVVGSGTGAPARVGAFRPSYVSSPRHIERSVRISRTALPHSLRLKAYGTYPASATFGLPYRTP